MNHGTFSGKPEALWLVEKSREDRRMQLLADFAFTDPARKTWPAPKGTVVDGASIPRALWTVVGSPYTGDYRMASVVHDVAVVDAGGNAAKRLAADRMFFHACRAGGCSVRQAVILYIGVRIGAWTSRVPAWKAAAALESTGPRISRRASELRLEHDFREIARLVLASKPSDDPAVIERRTDAALANVTGLRRRQRVARLR
jgi:hypothetical protein